MSIVYRRSTMLSRSATYGRLYFPESKTRSVSIIPAMVSKVTCGPAFADLPRDPIAIVDGENQTQHFPRPIWLRHRTRSGGSCLKTTGRFQQNSCFCLLSAGLQKVVCFHPLVAVHSFVGENSWARLQCVPLASDNRDSRHGARRRQRAVVQQIMQDNCEGGRCHNVQSIDCHDCLNEAPLHLYAEETLHLLRGQPWNIASDQAVNA